MPSACRSRALPAFAALVLCTAPALAADKPLTRTDKATPKSLEGSVAAAGSAKACEEYGGPKTLTLKEKLFGEKKDRLDKVFGDPKALASLRGFAVKEWSGENMDARQSTMAYLAKPSLETFAHFGDHVAPGHEKELNISKIVQARACFDALLAEMKKGGKPNSPAALGFAQWLQRQATVNVADTYARWINNKAACGFQKYGAMVSKADCK